MTMLSPSPKFAVQDANGLPAVGWTLTTYAAGTSTPKATYTDITLGSANANPITLNARGECDLWLSGSYKFVLKDAVGATVWTVDEIRDVFTGQTFTNSILAGTLTVSSTAVTWSGNPTHSGNHTFSGNVTVNGNTAIGNASSDTLSVAPNAVTWTNNPTHSGIHTWSGNQIWNGTSTFNAAITNAALTWSGNPTHSGTHTWSSAQTYSADPAGHIIGDTWTPTFTSILNLDSTPTATTVWNYARVGAFVVLHGRGIADPTATSTATQFRFTLPVNTTFTSAGHGGGFFSSTLDIKAAYVEADTSVGNENKLAVSFTSNSASAAAFNFHILAAYRIL